MKNHVIPSIRIGKLYPLLFFVLSIACSTLLSAQDKNPYLVKSFPESVNKIEVVTSGGSIWVAHENGEKPRVEVYVKGNNGKELSKEEAASRFEEYYDLSIETSGNVLKAYARSKNNMNWKNSLSVSFKVYSPAKIETDLKTSGGSVSMSGLTGNQKLMTSGGSLSISDIKGNVDGKTSGGSILLKNIQGNISSKTSGGSIDASLLSGKIDIGTSGGSLSLEDLKGEIRAFTSGGSISGNNISGALETKTSGGGISLTKMRCSLDAATSAGSVNIEMENLSGYVKIMNSAGNVSLKLPANQGLDLNIQANRISIPDLKDFSGDSNSKSIKGTVKGGGVPVSVRSSSGTVSIRM